MYSITQFKAKLFSNETVEQKKKERKKKKGTTPSLLIQYKSKWILDLRLTRHAIIYIGECRSPTNLKNCYCREPSSHDSLYEII